MNSGGGVNFLPEAREDISELAEYFSRAGVTSANGFIETVLVTLNDLTSMPGKGSLKSYRSRRLEGIRSWSVRGFQKILILYRPTSAGIDVVAIAHGARNLRSLLMRRLQKLPPPQG